MFRNQFIKYDDKLYILKKTLKEEYNPNIEVWKDYLGADLVLKKENVLYFVELVPDLEIIPNDVDLQEPKQ